MPERVQKGQGTMRAFTFENATKIYFGGGCVKEHLLDVLGQPLLELRDTREQHPVLAPQREIVTDACKKSVHAADHLIGT